MPDSGCATLALLVANIHIELHWMLVNMFGPSDKWVFPPPLLLPSSALIVFTCLNFAHIAIRISMHISVVYKENAIHMETTSCKFLERQCFLSSKTICSIDAVQALASWVIYVIIIKLPWLQSHVQIRLIKPRVLPYINWRKFYANARYCRNLLET